MQIAFLTHEPFDPPSGGGSAEAAYLIRELVRRGHQVHLFAPQPDRVPQLEQRFGIRIHPFRTWRMGRYTWFKTVKYLAYPYALYWNVRRVARSVNFDLVFAQHTISAVAAGWLGVALGIPTVMNYLDFLTAFLETWPRYLAPPSLVARLKDYEIHLPQRSAAAGILTVSDPLADRIAATGYPREKILPIYYGFDDAFFSPDKLDDKMEASHQNSGHFKVVMHGSFDHHHLSAIAVDTIRHVVKKYPDAEFHFVGPATRAVRDLFDDLADLVERGNLHCTGFVPYGYVPRALSGASVGLVPYAPSEGVHCAFAAKVVEYLALGIPVVSTPMEAVRRYFVNEPLIRFGEFSGASLAEHICEWIEMPEAERRAIAKATQKRVAEKLEWRTIAKEAVDFVERIANDHAIGPRGK